MVPESHSIHQGWLVDITAINHDWLSQHVFHLVNIELPELVPLRHDNQRGRVFHGRIRIIMKFDPVLVLAQSYYWRIDEVNIPDPCKWMGDVWEFTTVDHLVIDEF